MIVGSLRLELVIYESRSLKDKRRVIKSMKDRLSNRFVVSIAEVSHLDSHKQATIGMALVSNEARHVHEQFDKIVDLVRADPRISLIDYERTFY